MLAEPGSYCQRELILKDAQSHFGLRRGIFQNLVNFPLCLAPMVGLSNFALREVLRSYLPREAKTLWPTEMLNSRRVPYEEQRSTPEAFWSPQEVGMIPQVLGNEELPLRKSVEKLQNWGALGIDINMGCPVQKALKHNYGVALMGDAHYAAEVVRFVKKSAMGPVCVKLRAMEESQPRPLVEFVEGLVDAGADWITLHPRRPDQQRRGVADWSQVKGLREKLAIPVIGNGDIQTAADVYQRLAEGCCDLVMAGRALAARPWMFWQIAEDWGFTSPQLGQAPRSELEEGQEYGRVLVRLTEINKNYFGEDYALRRIRFWVRTTSCWLIYGQTLIGLVSQSRSCDEIISRTQELFAKEMPMLKKTELRQ